MLKIGVIGYGSRIRHMAKRLGAVKIPYAITQLVDPRMDEIKQYDDLWLEGCEYFTGVEEFLKNADVDGVMIGTHCVLHTSIACAIKKLNVPIFLEKPVAIDLEQLRQLAQTFADFKPQVVVSFPLRVTPLMVRVKEFVDDGAIGPIANMVAYNDPAIGRIYYNGWYRNFDQTGGLFLQKSTHDFDCLYYLLGREPKQICAMNSRNVFGGDKPHDLRCRDCDESKTCPESTFNKFYRNKEFPDASPQENDWCVFSRDIQNEDSGSAIVEYENGVQATYTQHFFTGNSACRRGGRLYGYNGTLEYNWGSESIKIFSHQDPSVQEINMNIPAGSHSGGDIELCYDFLLAMKENKPTRSPLSAGIVSALSCLKARESAKNKKFCSINVNELLGS